MRGDIAGRRRPDRRARDRLRLKGLRRGRRRLAKNGRRSQHAQRHHSRPHYAPIQLTSTYIYHNNHSVLARSGSVEHIIQKRESSAPASNKGILRKTRSKYFSPLVQFWLKYGNLHFIKHSHRLLDTPAQNRPPSSLSTHFTTP